jgi:hypothetical protein
MFGLRRRRARAELIPDFDPGRARRAEHRARELMRSVVADDEYDMYVELGFIRVLATNDDEPGGYGYLIYPQRPIVAYDTETAELLNEYCVGFPDRTEPLDDRRLPNADDVLAKWMALRADEHGLIEDANMHLPGRQLDPAHIRRDLERLRHWEARRAAA